MQSPFWTGALGNGLLLLLAMTLIGCSSARLADNQGQAARDVSPRLASPLLDRAEHLALSATGKNRVALLEIGEEALLARVHLIRSARESIAIQTMIWANDETGRMIIYELIEAARRGVRVQLLIDHLASEQHLEIADFLAHVHANFQVKLYNPVPGFLGRKMAEPSALDKLYAVIFNFKTTNQRMHNKVFLVDDLVGITGGRNYQNAYYDQARGMNYKDRDLMVIGPVVEEMRSSFDDYWSLKRSVSLRDLEDVSRYHRQGIENRWLSRQDFQLNGLLADLDSAANRADLISRLFVDSLAEVDEAYFVADDPRQLKSSFWSGRESSRITQELAELVSQTEESLYIQTPYLVLTTPAIELFRTLRQEHPSIDIRISTNSLAATDSWYVYALSYKQKQVYLDSLQFRIYEFMPLPGDLETFMPRYEKLKARPLTPAEYQRYAHKAEPASAEEVVMAEERQDWQPGPEDGQPYLCLHAKSLVVDEHVSFVGSYNLDPRSENINTECGVVIRDKEFARQLGSRIGMDMFPHNSWVVAKKNRPALINEPNAIFVMLSNMLPLIDVWPFRYSASFELKKGMPPVDVGHEDFYRNYRDVGSFPQVRGRAPGKEIGARGTKAFLSFVKPLL